MGPLEGHLRTLMQHLSQTVETFDMVCRRNKKFENEIRGGAALQAAIDESRAALMRAKKFMEHRYALVYVRTEALAENQSYPLFEGVR